MRKLLEKLKLKKKVKDFRSLEIDKLLEKVDMEKVAKTLNINHSFLVRRLRYYFLKYGVVFGLLFVFNVFAINVYFFGSVFLIGFLLSLDFTTMVLGRVQEFRDDSDEVWNHEKIVLILQLMAFFLCTKGIMFSFLKPFFGCLFSIFSVYVTLELMRRNSDNPEAVIKRYIKYIPLIMLPLVVIDPFPMIFAIIYHIFIILLIPGIIFGMFYFVMLLKDKIHFRIFGISFILLYIMLALCL